MIGDDKNERLIINKHIIYYNVTNLQYKEFTEEDDSGNHVRSFRYFKS